MAVMGNDQPKRKGRSSNRSSGRQGDCNTQRGANDRINIRDVVWVDLVARGSLDGWVHTHGMITFGLPDLEMRQVPQPLMRAAGHMLLEIADYMVHSDRAVHLGEHMHIDCYGTVRFSKLEPISEHEDHYTWERWAITDDVKQPCPYCD